MAYSIKHAAEKTGLSIDTLRYYDKMGIVSPQRKDNGYRYYDEGDIVKLEYAVVMKFAKFSLADIKSMMQWLETHDCDDDCNGFFRKMLNNNINKLEKTIATYSQIVVLMKSVMPMIENTAMYNANSDELNTYRQSIFQSIVQGEEMEEK